VPIDKAHQLARELASRGLAVRVLPADSWARLVMRLPTEPDSIAEARDQALAFVVRGGQWERERHGIDAVLRELLDNAARHGNRGDPDTSIAVDLLVDQDRLVIAVTDEGKGFDARAALGAEERSGDAVARAEARWRAGERGGLGLMMIAGWADRLTFEAGGRTAVVEKRR
jgi:anti-sigma regulatory factor (Ser/Thr protein kinase)